METVTSILWKRLDSEGHDACRLLHVRDGWQLLGAAVFEHDSKPVSLSYSVQCDLTWRTLSATVEGWVDDEEIRLDIARCDDTWLLDGERQTGVSGCVDLDLGFTPATNLLPLRRINLAVGSQAPAPAAYLRFPEMRMEMLEQTYRRTGATAYAYAAPTLHYATTLEVADTGFVTEYPLLWKCVSHLATDAGNRSGV